MASTKIPPVAETHADFPAHVVAMVARMEAELDLMWPGWRTCVPFHRTDYAIKARIKWLLKRRSLLLTRVDGLPSPRDWDVLVVRDGQDPTKCYAHPVQPVVAQLEAVTREPPPVVTLQSTDTL